MRSQMSMKSSLHIKPKQTKPAVAPMPPKATPESLVRARQKGVKWKTDAFKRRAILLCLLICASAVAIGWSLGKLAPMNQRQENLNKQVSEVTDSIARLEFSIHPAETEKVESDYSLAIQSLFDETTGFPQWQEDLQHQAMLLGLQVKAFLGTMQTQKVAVGTVRILPTTLEIAPLTGSEQETNSVFQRLIQFNDHLFDPAKRVELISMQVVAGTNTIQRV